MGRWLYLLLAAPLTLILRAADAGPLVVFVTAALGLIPLAGMIGLAIFAFVAGLYALISLAGESTWLEGVLLCAFYLILAVGTFFAPT